MKMLSQSHTDLKETFILRNLFRIFQEAAPTYTVLSCPLHRKISTVLLEVKEQYMKQSSCSIIALPEDGAVRPTTCRVSGFYNITVNLIQ